MDSIALAYWLRPSMALTIDYGQAPATGEVRASAAVADALNIPHKVITVACGHLGSGDLMEKPPLSMAPMQEWWPFRNQLLVTLAGMALIPEMVAEVLIGTVKSDAVHADGTVQFIESLDQLMSLQEGRIGVRAPAIEMSSAELIRKSGIPREILAFAHSCHTGPVACGRCRGCNKHFMTLEELGFEPY